jgi:hypothetical protein
MRPPTHLKNRWSLTSYLLSFSLTLRVYSYDEHRMLLKTRGHLHSTVGSWCVRINLRCLLIQSFDLHTAGLHHLPTQWGVRANCNSITVTRFVISSFTFHLTRLDLQHIRYALTINFWKKIFCTVRSKSFVDIRYSRIAQIIYCKH